MVQLPLFLFCRVNQTSGNGALTGSRIFRQVPKFGIHVSKALVRFAPKSLDQAIAAWKGLSGLYAEVELGNIDRTQAGYPVWVSCLFFFANFFADSVAFAQICKKRHDRLIQYILKKWVSQLYPFLLRCVFCGTCRFFDRKGARTKRA